LTYKKKVCRTLDPRRPVTAQIQPLIGAAELYARAVCLLKTDVEVDGGELMTALLLDNDNFSWALHCD